MGIIKGAFSVLIPGGSLLVTRRYLLGSLVFVLWGVLFEAYLFVSVVSPGGMPGYAEPALLAGACAVYALNAIAALFYAYRNSRGDLAERRTALYSQALAAFVAGDDAKSDQLLRALLKIDVLDADCLFLRAQVALRQGKKHRAKRLFRKCADFDEKDKWSWEIQRALEKA